MENEKVKTFINSQKNWHDEIALLHEIILKAGLFDEIKWGKPCYMFENKNIVIIQSFKEKLSLQFFKGVHLKDEAKLLEKHSANMQEARSLNFTNIEQIKALENTIHAYLFEAIEVEKAGIKLAPKEKAKPNIIDELQAIFEQDNDFKEAFFKLTPGRQRQYTLFFEGAKQSKTRTSRIEKYIDKIKDNKGMND